MASFLPLLIIFDLDYTLWPLYIHNSAPFTVTKTGKIIDCNYYTCKYYPEVPEIFKKLKSENIKIAVASCNIIDEANQLLKLFDLDKYISFKEIFFAKDKTNHLKNIQLKSKIPFDKMIYFDDEIINVKIGRKLGIFSEFLKYNGISMNTLEEAIKRYEDRQQYIQIQNKCEQMTSQKYYR